MQCRAITSKATPCSRKAEECKQWFKDFYNPEFYEVLDACQDHSKSISQMVLISSIIVSISPVSCHRDTVRRPVKSMQNPSSGNQIWDKI